MREQFLFLHNLSTARNNNSCLTTARNLTTALPGKNLSFVSQFWFFVKRKSSGICNFMNKEQISLDTNNCKVFP